MLFTPIKPMLISTGKDIIDDSSMIFDIKWDGWRVLIHKQGNKIMAFSRHGNVLTSQFPELDKMIEHIKADTVILDCEAVVLRDGISKFDDISYRGRLSNKSKIERAAVTHPATFVAFDILATDKPLINEPLSYRRQLLKTIVEPSNELIVTPSIETYGEHLFELTKERGMEGVVGKRLNSTYQLNTRSKDWIKYKHFKMMDTVILGYKENPFTLIVGCHFKTKRNKAIASVEFGFKPEEKHAFRKIAKQILLDESRGVQWVQPVLCCKVQYLEHTDNHQLRIVSFKGYEFNKRAEDCVWCA